MTLDSVELLDDADGLDGPDQSQVVSRRSGRGWLVVVAGLALAAGAALLFARSSDDDAESVAPDPVPESPLFDDLAVLPASLPDGVEPDPVYATESPATVEHSGVEYGLFARRSGSVYSQLVLVERAPIGERPWSVPPGEQTAAVEGRHGSFDARRWTGARGVELYFDGPTSSYRVTAARGGTEKAVEFAAAIDVTADRLVVDAVSGAVAIQHGAAPVGEGSVRTVVYYDGGERIVVSTDPGRLPGPAGLALARPGRIQAGFVQQQPVWTTAVDGDNLVALEWADGQAVWVSGDRSHDELIAIAQSMVAVAPADWAEQVPLVEVEPDWTEVRRDRGDLAGLSPLTQESTNRLVPEMRYGVASLPDGWTIERAFSHSFDPGGIDGESALGVSVVESGDGRRLVDGWIAVLVGPVVADFDQDPSFRPDAIDLASPIPYVASVERESGVVMILAERSSADGPEAEMVFIGGASHRTDLLEKTLSLVAGNAAGDATESLPDELFVLGAASQNLFVEVHLSLVVEESLDSANAKRLEVSLSSEPPFALAGSLGAEVELVEVDGSTSYWEVVFDDGEFRWLSLVRVDPGRTISISDPGPLEDVARGILRSFDDATIEEFAEWTGLEIADESSG